MGGGRVRGLHCSLRADASDEHMDKRFSVNHFISNNDIFQSLYCACVLRYCGHVNMGHSRTSVSKDPRASPCHEGTPCSKNILNMSNYKYMNTQKRKKKLHPTETPREVESKELSLKYNTTADHSM